MASQNISERRFLSTAKQLNYTLSFTSVATFLDVTWELVPEKIDIILGNFNMNTLDDETFQPLKKILDSYEMVAREPAYHDGGLLNHVYIHKNFLRK